MTKMGIDKIVDVGADMPEKKRRLLLYLSLKLRPIIHSDVGTVPAPEKYTTFNVGMRIARFLNRKLMTLCWRSILYKWTYEKE